MGLGANASQQTYGSQNPRERIPIPNRCGIRRKTRTRRFPEGTRARGKTEAGAAQIMHTTRRSDRQVKALDQRSRTESIVHLIG